MLLAFLHDQDGATAIEYGLMAAFFATLMIAGLTQFGAALDVQVGDITSAIESV